jgi:hypothetical protein
VLLVLLKEVFVQRHYYSWNDLLGGHSVLWNAPMLARPVLPGMVGNFVLWFLTSACIGPPWSLCQAMPCCQGVILRMMQEQCYSSWTLYTRMFSIF